MKIQAIVTVGGKVINYDNISMVKDMGDGTVLLREEDEYSFLRTSWNNVAVFYDGMGVGDVVSLIRHHREGI